MPKDGLSHLYPLYIETARHGHVATPICQYQIHVYSFRRQDDNASAFMEVELLELHA